MATVLAIDDDVDILNVYSAVFSAEGHTLITCNDPLIALSLVQQHNPDCIILDLCLPTEDIGINIARHLKSNNNTQDIPIVVITGSLDHDTQQHAFVAGSLDLITKPFSVKDVLQRTKPAIELGSLQKLVSRVMSKL